MKLIDVTGQTFGQLLVIGPSAEKTSRWLCRCTCGGFAHRRGWYLRTGRDLTCGCMKGGVPVHGASTTREHHSWQSMIQRCENPKATAYLRYGAKGIVVCPRWRGSFVDFLVDMGERPGNTSLDRINNDGNYEPGNCRWATPAEQSRNRRCSMSTEVALDVRARLESGEAGRAIARDIGVSEHAVSRARKAVQP